MSDQYTEKFDYISYYFRQKKKKPLFGYGPGVMPRDPSRRFWPARMNIVEGLLSPFVSGGKLVVVGHDEHNDFGSRSLSLTEVFKRTLLLEGRESPYKAEDRSMFFESVLAFVNKNPKDATRVITAERLQSLIHIYQHDEDITVKKPVSQILSWAKTNGFELSGVDLSNIKPPRSTRFEPR